MSRVIAQNLLVGLGGSFEDVSEEDELDCNPAPILEVAEIEEDESEEEMEEEVSSDELIAATDIADSC